MKLLVRHQTVYGYPASAGRVAEQVDLDALLALAGRAPVLSSPKPVTLGTQVRPGLTLAYAHDRAFALFKGACYNLLFT